MARWHRLHDAALARIGRNIAALERVPDRPAIDRRLISNWRAVVTRHRNRLVRTVPHQQLFQPRAHVFDAARDAPHHFPIGIKRSVVERGHVVKTFHRRATGLVHRFLAAQRAQQIDPHRNDLLVDLLADPLIVTLAVEGFNLRQVLEQCVNAGTPNRSRFGVLDGKSGRDSGTRPRAADRIRARVRMEDTSKKGLGRLRTLGWDDSAATFLQSIGCSTSVAGWQYGPTSFAQAACPRSLDSEHFEVTVVSNLSESSSHDAHKPLFQEAELLIADAVGEVIEHWGFAKRSDGCGRCCILRASRCPQQS